MLFPKFTPVVIIGMGMCTTLEIDFMPFYNLDLNESDNKVPIIARVYSKGEKSAIMNECEIQPKPEVRVIIAPE